mmetsp:Transcript_58169/g.116897  ORF Transcript_58169/g.116897 Transcript_58169/m.116897 type:complete len:265 (+) Transcript_58169:172-966(+)
MPYPNSTQLSSLHKSKRKQDRDRCHHHHHFALPVLRPDASWNPTRKHSSAAANDTNKTKNTSTASTAVCPPGPAPAAPAPASEPTSEPSEEEASTEPKVHSTSIELMSRAIITLCLSGGTPYTEPSRRSMYAAWMHRSGSSTKRCSASPMKRSQPMPVPLSAAPPLESSRASASSRLQGTAQNELAADRNSTKLGEGHEKGCVAEVLASVRKTERSAKKYTDMPMNLASGATGGRATPSITHRPSSLAPHSKPRATASSTLHLS